MGPWPSKFKNRLRRLRYEYFIIKHVQGWRKFLLWRLGIKHHFTATIGTEKFEIDDERGRIAFSSFLRSLFDSYPLRVHEENGLGVADLPFMSRNLHFYFSKEQRRNAIFVLKEFFLKEPYARLQVSERDVLDIGSYIGDSAIYFCLRGAKRVISLEPFPLVCKIAKLNFDANGFSERITLLCEGAGSEGIREINDTSITSRSSDIGSSVGEAKVRINSLSGLAKRFELSDAVLKVNCEGCEYDLLLGSPSDVLERFSQIVLEYHYGPKQLLKKLKESGFSAKAYNTHFSYNRDNSKPWCENGYIFATRGSRYSSQDKREVSLSSTNTQ